MLSVLSAGNWVKPGIPTLMLAAPSVPFFAGAVGWGLVSRFLPESFHRFVDDKMWSFYQHLVLFFFENVSGVKVVLYGDTEEIFEEKENVLYISNHQSSVDWVAADMLAVRQGSMGHLRYMLKDTLQYVPLYGWYFYHHGCIYVRRGKSFRHDITERSLDYLQKTPRPGWIVIFPEGTRFSASKRKLREKTDAYCQKQNINPPFRNLFAPRSKGLSLTLKALRSRLSAVYDVTIAYTNPLAKAANTRMEAPDMFRFVCSGRGSEIHIHVRRIPIEQLSSKSDADIDMWLRDRFVEKERLLNNFFTSNFHFPEKMEEESFLPLWRTFPVFLFWCGVVTPLVCTSSGRRLFAFTWISGSLASIFWMKFKNAA